MPKVGGSKGKQRMVGSEEPEGLRPKRAKVEVSLQPGVDAWMTEIGLLMRVAMSTLIWIAVVMEQRNWTEEEKLKREKEKESKGGDQEKPRDPFRENGSSDSDGGGDFFKVINEYIYIYIY